MTITIPEATVAECAASQNARARYEPRAKESGASTEDHCIASSSAIGSTYYAVDQFLVGDRSPIVYHPRGLEFLANWSICSSGRGPESDAERA